MIDPQSTLSPGATGAKVPVTPNRRGYQRGRTLLSLLLASLLVLGGAAAAARGLLPPAATASATAQTRFIAGPNDSPDAAIQQVIQAGNDAQVQALSSGDPGSMAASSAPDYYTHLAQTNQDLLNNGVSSIALQNIEWGPIAVNGNSATATTFETWRTAFSDGSVEVGRDQNDYTLVLDNGTWKITADNHPLASQDQRIAPGSQPRSPAPAPQPPFPAPSGNQDTSHNWSGYAASGGNYTAVSASWVIPSFNPSASAGADATWVGIGGVQSRDLIQAGTEATAAGDGHTQYQAWIELLPRASQPIPLAVSPGDSVTVSLAEQSTNLWLISLLNNTTGQNYQRTVNYSSSHSSAEWVQEAPSIGRSGRASNIAPLDDFGTLTFSNGSVTVDGQQMSIAAAGAQPITMLNRSGAPVAVPSALTPDGSGFNVSHVTPAAPSSVAPRAPRGRYVPY